MTDNVLARIAHDTGGKWTPAQVSIIRGQLAPKASPDELALFLSVAAAKGLDPFSRQIHAVHRWDGRQQREVMAIQTGIDGYRALAARSGRYAGNEDPRYAPACTCGHAHEDHGQGGCRVASCTGCKGWAISDYPYSATATIWALVGGQRVPFEATARWSEYAPVGKKGLSPMWKRMPRLMLAKCAEALALRKAFPEELSGIYTSEEMQQADTPKDVTPLSVRSAEPGPGLEQQYGEVIDAYQPSAARGDAPVSPDREAEAHVAAEQVVAEDLASKARALAAQLPSHRQQRAAEAVASAEGNPAALHKLVGQLEAALADLEADAEREAIRAADEERQRAELAGEAQG